MTLAVLVDSAVLISFLHKRDRRHHDGTRLMERILDGSSGILAVTDYIVDEVLTFTVAKGATRATLDKAIAFLLGDGERAGAFVLHHVEPDHFAEGLRLLRRHRERRLSLTDCTSVAVMETAGIRSIASFDGGFDGIVPRIS